MAKTKRIPIKTAADIGKNYGQSQVIIVTWDDINKVTTVVTWGKSLQDCEQAAKGGNFVKKALGWPPEQCKAEPARVTQKQQQQEKRRANILEGWWASPRIVRESIHFLLTSQFKEDIEPTAMKRVFTHRFWQVSIYFTRKNGYQMDILWIREGEQHTIYRGPVIDGEGVKQQLMSESHVNN